MRKNAKTRPFSEQISDICKMFDQVVKDFQYSSEKVNELDKLTQDYLHALELDNLKYEERAKVATLLMKCRKERREHKDNMAVLEPMVVLLEGQGKDYPKFFEMVLGRTRKAEERLKNRTYCPKVGWSIERDKG